MFNPLIKADAGQLKITGTLGVSGEFTLLNSWKTLAPMSVTRYGAGLVNLANGKVLAIGGYDSPGNCEIYDPALGVWRSTGNLNTGRQNDHNNFGCLLQDGRVFVAGCSFGSRKSAEIYDPITEIWTPIANSPNDHGESCAMCTMPDGRVLIVGNQNANSHKCDIYDPIADSWSTTQDMAAQHYPTLVVTGGPSNIVMLGGSPGGTEIYDYSGSNTWSSHPGGGGALVALPDGRILSGDSAIYDQGTNTWTFTGNSYKAVHQNATQIALPSGKVIIVGGFITNSPFVLSDVTEIWDPVTTEWTIVDPTDIPKEFYTLITFNGGVMCMGGFGTGGSLTNVQMFFESQPFITPPAGVSGQIQVNAGGLAGAFAELEWSQLAKTLEIRGDGSNGGSIIVTAIAGTGSNAGLYLNSDSPDAAGIFFNSVDNLTQIAYVSSDHSNVNIVSVAGGVVILPNNGGSGSFNFSANGNLIAPVFSTDVAAGNFIVDNIRPNPGSNGNFGDYNAGSWIHISTDGSVSVNNQGPFTWTFNGDGTFSTGTVINGGVFSSAFGTHDAPGYTFTSSETTGMYLDSSDGTVRFVSNGGAAAWVDAGGNFVVNAAGGSGFTMVNGGDQIGLFYVVDPTNDPHGIAIQGNQGDGSTALWQNGGALLKMNNGGSTALTDVSFPGTWAAFGVAAPSALLDMQSTSRGLLPPRMNTTERDAIASPATGLMLYNTTVNKLQVWDGSTWQNAW